MPRQKTTGKVISVEPIWLNSKEACRYIGCGEQFLRDLRDTCKIKTSRLTSKFYLYSKESIDRYIEENIIVDI